VKGGCLKALNKQEKGEMKITKGRRRDDDSSDGGVNDDD